MLKHFEQINKEYVNPISQLIEKSAILDEETAGNLDKEFRAALSKTTKGMSPIALINAYIDWLAHLSISPGKQLLLLQSLFRKLSKIVKFGISSARGKPVENPSKLEERVFNTEAWQGFPFNLFSQSYLMVKELVSEASNNVEGMSLDREELVAFINGQILEVISPANFPIINPDINAVIKEEKGKNLKRGLKNLIKDITKPKHSEKAPSEFVVGENIAATPGKVVLQNRLIELIQYKPTTKEVNEEPVLIVPPWIMKYYILDLSERNSLVKYLVDQGKTVFLISWKNPTEEDRDMSMDDYLNMGFMESLEAVKTIIPDKKVNAVGYCIGGTLLSIGAAKLAQDHDDSLNSISLFTAQTDFTEPGEIKLFLNDSQLTFLESKMWKQGYLQGDDMGKAFKALRSADLIWGPRVQRYLLGKESSHNDLMTWNADSTRMPYRMHADYLRCLYLNNELAEGKFKVGGKPVHLADIEAPFFVVGTVTDHVAPWKSVFKIHRLAYSEITFLLTSGGHNAGIICGPSHPRRSYQIHTQKPSDKSIDSDTWVNSMESNPGSWWPVWDEWLDKKSSGKRKATATIGASKKGYKALRDAPGEYVLAQ